MSFENTSQYSYIGSKDTLGGIPVVEQTQAYIATFKGAISAAPEAADSTSFFITYLVDKDGNISKVSEDSDAQRDIIQNFSLGDSVITRIDQGTLINPQLSGEHKVLGLGTFQPILLSQTGSGKQDEAFFINFLEAGQLPPSNDQLNYKGNMFLSGAVGNFNGTVGDALAWIDNLPDSADIGNNVILNSTSIIIGPTPGQTVAFGFSAADSLIGPASTWHSGSIPDPSAAEILAWSDGAYPAEATGSYKLDDTEPITVDSFTVTIETGIYNFNKNKTYTATAALIKGNKNVGESDIFSNVEVIGKQNFSITAAEDLGSNSINAVLTRTNINFNINVGSLNLQQGDEFFVLLANPLTIQGIENDTFSGGEIPSVGSGDVAQWKDYLRFEGIEQEISGSTLTIPNFKYRISAQNPPVFVQEDERPFFTTGSATSTVLTASNDISSNYRANNFQVMPTASSDFGFSPINLDFQIQPGDKIRFEYNEDNVFTIFDVNLEGGVLYLTLDRAVGSSLNIDNFVLYRPQADGKFLTLNVIKNEPQGGEVDFTGIIIPKFASKELKDNASEIVSKLKQDGIIED
jgi:hypothetical protein